MLVLTRRIGETVVVGDEVFITLLGVKGNQIRLGFNAPEHISIHRQEIYLRVQEEKKRHLDLVSILNSKEAQRVPLLARESHQYRAH